MDRALRQESNLEWTPAALRQLRSKAIAWYQKHRRNLPWRETHDPYAIWVSEVMLQQTQVATVIPYYYRFLTSFPSVEDLASASIDEVYQHWAGLGYYRRAKQLHAAAQQVVSQHAGKFPTNYSDVSKLPGIGRYTAGAILSFSMDQRVPIVEANTQRLYARLIHLEEDTALGSSQAALWDFAERILPAKTGSGELNQACMEIGSQICLPKNPCCLLCPLQSLCPTFANGTQDRIPLPKRAKTYTDLLEAALVIRDAQGRILMRLCGPKERWAGLWDFPRFDITTYAEHSMRKRIEELFSKRFDAYVEIGKELHQLSHSVTRYRITLKSFEAHLLDLQPAPWSSQPDTMWASKEQMTKLALSSSGKRLWTWLQKHS